MGQSVSSNPLRLRLLAGVAVAGLLAPLASPAVAGEPDKWQPWIEAGGMVGTDHSFGAVDFFIPVWQDQASLLFADLRGQFSSDDVQEGNFGLGFRTRIGTDWIIGGYAYLDIQNSPNDNLFYQGSVGAELLSVDWDLRVNGYFPFNSTADAPNEAGVQISGNTIQMQSGEEKALFGFDGEVGWRLPIFPADGAVDVRVYAGGYYFANSDVDTVAGPRGRVEGRLYDIDFLGTQSRLTINGEIQWDQPRGTQAFGGLELRIPLGFVTGSAGVPLAPLDRRMVDRVQRDVDIVSQAGAIGKKEDVIVDGLTVSTHDIVFASANGSPGGKGTQKKPVALDAAVVQPGTSNAIIVALGGTPFSRGQALSLADGQALIGGGSTVGLTGAKSGQHVDVHFPGTQPVLTVANDPKLPVIVLASAGQNRVTGLDIEGTFGVGIQGLNVSRAVLTDNVIDGAVLQGIAINETNAGGPVPASAFIEIERNTIDNSGAGTGILVDTELSDATARSQTIIISYNVVDPPVAGIAVVNGIVGAGSILSQTLTIGGNDVSSATLGIEAANFVSSSGVVVQDLTIVANTVRYNVNGIVLFDVIIDAGSTLSQTATIASNEVALNSANGIGILVSVARSAALAQSLTVTANTVFYNDGDGISLANAAVSTTLVTQAIQVLGNRVTSTRGSDAIYIGTAVTSGAITQAVLAVNDNTIASAAGNGIHIHNSVGPAGILSQGSSSSPATIDGNLVSYVGDSGIFVSNQVFGSTGTSLSQVLAVDGNTVNRAGETGAYPSNSGIFLSTGVSGLAVATQIFTVTNNVATNVDNGLRIAAYAFNFATVSQAIDVAGNSFSDDANGIVIRGGVGFSGGTVSQGLTIADNTLSANTGYGLFVKANGYQLGFVTQSGAVTGNTITDNRFGRAGAIFHASGQQASGGVQTLAFAGNTISHNQNGFEARAAYDGGLQNFTFASNTIASNSLAGIKVDAIAASPTQTLSLLAGSGNHVVGNAGPGVFLYNLHPASQTFNINGNDVSGNNGGGPQTVVIGTGVINP